MFIDVLIGTELGEPTNHTLFVIVVVVLLLELARKGNTNIEFVVANILRQKNEN